MVLKVMCLKLQRGSGQDFFGEQNVRNDDCVLAATDVDKITGKSYCEKLLNTKFVWDRNSLSQADAVSIVMCLIDKGIIRESVK